MSAFDPKRTFPNSPAQLGTDADSAGGAGVQLVFRREICWPDGRIEIEGVTPPQALPAPATPEACGG